MLAKTVDRSFA